MYLAIDPGSKPGFAILDSRGKLLDVGVVLPEKGAGFCVPIRSAVVEYQQIYDGTPAPKANDIVRLATRAGRVAERFDIPEDRMFWPCTWKGSIDKAKHHPRIFAALDPHEQHLLASKLKGISKTRIEDAMDAVGLAKWAWDNGKF